MSIWENHPAELQRAIDRDRKGGAAIVLGALSNHEQKNSDPIEPTSCVDTPPKRSYADTGEVRELRSYTQPI